MADDSITYSYLISLTLPFAAAAIEFVLHLLVGRYIIKTGTIISTMVAYTLGLLVLAGLQFGIFRNGELPLGEVLGLFGANFVLYSAMAFLFFAFVNIGESSVRIRLLCELASAPEGMDQDTLTAHYNVDHIIQIRIDRLLKSGEMVCRDNRYYFTGNPRMLLIAKRTQRIQRMLLGRESFDQSLVLSKIE